jgi:pimeloyl-ACP methyl ester carboxylesterase
MSSWSSGNIVANDIKLHYYRTGGAKPPLILSHGITDNGLCWTRLAQHLEQDYDLIMVDARGHGLSDAPAEGYTVDHRAADLAGLIQGLGLDKPYLLGHSMGADTTAAVAATYPERVGCAILEDPPWGEQMASVEEREAWANEMRARMLERKARSAEAIIAMGRQTNPKWAEIEFGPWSEAKLQASLHVLESYSKPRPNWREIVAKITCPTLLITGDPGLGGIVTPRVADEVKTLAPHVKVARIDGAGHNIRRENFEAFIAVVAEFLNAVRQQKG